MGNTNAKKEKIESPTRPRSQSSSAAEVHHIRKPSTSQGTPRKKSNVSFHKTGDPSGSKLTQTNMDIIKMGMETPHSDIGMRIYNRLFTRRPDFATFFESVGRERWQSLGVALTQLLDDVAANIDDGQRITALAKGFGEQFVGLRIQGFKPDIFVTLADVMTTECIYLDQAVHPQTESMAAWSTLVSMLINGISDGYYGGLRKQRRMSRQETI